MVSKLQKHLKWYKESAMQAMAQTISLNFSFKEVITVSTSLHYSLHILYWLRTLTKILYFEQFFEIECPFLSLRSTFWADFWKKCAPNVILKIRTLTLQWCGYGTYIQFRRDMKTTAALESDFVHRCTDNLVISNSKSLSRKGNL